MFLGTSAKRAAYLMAIGWSEALPCTDLKEARVQGALHALDDGGRAAVLEVDVAAFEAESLDPVHLKLHELSSCRQPLESRLGIEVAAGVGNTMSVLLKGLKARDQKDKKKHDGIPSLKQIRDVVKSSPHGKAIHRKLSQ